MREAAWTRTATVVAGMIAAVAAGMVAGCGVDAYPLCLDCPDAARLVDDAGGTGGDGRVVAVDGSAMASDGSVMAGDGGVTDADPGMDACPTGTTEYCDDMDNDCDGRVDEGSMPNVGTPCSSNEGECVAGITQCVTGEIVCSGVLPEDEVCDSLDNDCDGAADEGVPPNGSCGPSPEGECSQGEYQCVGGVYQCVGAVYPSVEQCDDLDHDCDGNTLNGFDLLNDAQNCGACGNVCQTRNAITECDGTGDCAIAVCEPSYWDLNGAYADGCEYGPCSYQSPQEGCNQSDDDCDGIIDEDLAPPDICLTVGACGDPAPVQPTCTTDGWKCEYGPDVQVDGNGDILPETLCDEIDNDCDGLVDEGHPLKGTPCDDGSDGICRATGTYICDSASPEGAVVCAIDTPGQPAEVETCNNLDDDCDGQLDEGEVHDWVAVGNGVEMFAYEASRPDATLTSSGTANTHPCSKPGVLPWTNVTHPDAEAACASIGGRLCTELEWQRTCKALPPGPNPVIQGGAPNHVVFIEAEDYVFQRVRFGYSWVVDTSFGYSGAAALRVMPNDSTIFDGSYVSNSPRLDYNVEFNQAGTHYVWVLGWGANSSDDSVHVGLDGAAVATADRIDGFPDAWTWWQDTRDGSVARIDVPSTGVHTINVWMREDGFRIDALLLTTSPGYTPSETSSNGCEWSYGTSCNAYSASTCNGRGYDYDPATSGDQDGMTTTGQLAACYADWGAGGRVYDMSGNVKEWTAERVWQVNPQRGGSYTSTANGISCDYSFTVGDDDFFFPNVGFRCCR